MGQQRFRLWFGGRAAAEAELARVEEIEVTQEMDAFWEARVRMALCLDANGRWLHWPGDTTEAAAALYQRGVILRELPGTGLLRASVGWWNDGSDLERLVEGLAALA